jgi:hypothetical protein
MTQRNGNRSRCDLTKSQSDESIEKPEFVISLRPGIDWLSLGIALLIGVVFRYVHFHVPW